MSEVRQTTTVEKVDAPASKPLISLADLLAGVGWLAFQGTKLAAKGAVAAGILTCKGARAVSKSVRETRQARLSLSETATLISQAQDVRHAMMNLAAHAGLELAAVEAEQWKARVEKLVAANDRAGTLTLVKELITARQNRLQTTVLTLAVDTCREIGFTAVTLRAGNGLLIAKSEDGKRTLAIEAERSKEGGIRLHFDADGFHGGTCAQALDALERGLHARGVRFAVRDRRRKERRPAYDGRKLAQVIHARLRH
jgi:hypothetical protein